MEKQFSHLEAVRIILNTAITVIQKNEPGLTDQITISLAGRAGSTRFEEELIKPAIRRNIKDIAFEAQEELEKSQNKYSLKSLEASANDSEAAERKFDDMSIVLTHESGESLLCPINIKITNGNTSDNVGGWLAMDYLTFGEADSTHVNPIMRKKATGKKQFLNKIKNGAISDGDHDYFLWVFKKHSTFDGILNSAKLFSLLTIEPENFTINTSQSLPLQFNSDSNTGVDNSDITHEQRRRNLVKYMLTSTTIKIEKDLMLQKEVISIL